MTNINFHGMETIIIVDLEKDDGSIFTAIYIENKNGSIALFPECIEEVKKINKCLEKYLKNKEEVTQNEQ